MDTDQKIARAAVYSETGGPEVLRVIARPVREPGPDEVRVRVHRAGVNPTDWKFRVAAGGGMPVDPPQVPGQDGAGVVDAVGEAAPAELLGRRVWLWEAAYQRPDGTAQEFAVVPARQVVELPEGVSFDLGAALGVPFVTAHRCLTVTEEGPSRLGPGALDGRTVLVAGGAGAVGNAAIQLARWAGATVITTVSGPEKGRLASAAGADHVVDYRRQDAVAEVRKVAPQGVDTIVEVSPAGNAALDVAVLARGGSVAIYANNGGDEFTVPVRALLGPNARWQFVLLYTMPVRAKEAAIADITAALRAGAIRTGPEAGLPLIHFPLEQVAQAHAAVENGAVGKVLIDLAE
ncbi:NADPH:quinone reductase [Virgisporangium aliadipatigenens]|uniref:NADPH:quinone reductase n=1 Tax=Virgisporangium aliadipatigenens TaxID=741659 RepID=A0A8J4DPX9_9ACTN|nr:NADPH:quinone reductase [Virgisporangium aliadipatigenens]GIJ45133.1 NADPH:quinone reductase [Virgisporangium aliadipatigenens]